MRGSGLLRLLLVSIAVNATLGVWALLAGDFGRTQGKVLATSFLVSAAMIAVLVNLPAARRRYLWPVPGVAAVVGAAAIVWFIFLMWFEVEREVAVKLGGSGLVLAAAGSLAGLMALVVPPPRLPRARALHVSLLALLVVLILAVIWTERGGASTGRVVGIVGVLTAAVTLGMPVLARVKELPAKAAEGADAIHFCPRCGSALAESARAGSPAACGSCGARFEVTIDQL